MEVGALVGAHAPGTLFPSPQHAWSVINVVARLHRVVDLTRRTPQQLVGTTVQELTGDWRSYAIRHQLAGKSGPAPLAPTQRLGQALYQQASLEGVITYSARQPFAKVLAVFPQRLAANGSRISFRDPVTRKVRSIP